MSDAESIFLAEFERRERGFLEAYLVPSSPLERLAVMQHFGAPTRLLDVTRSPYVAAFFAAEAPPVEAKAFAVWALDTTLMRDMLGRTIQGDARDKHRERFHQELRAFDGADYDPGRYLIEDGLDERLGTELMETILRDFPASSGTVRPGVIKYEPLRVSSRLSVQQSLFLFPHVADETFMANLAAMGCLNRGIVKMTVPLSERGRVLEQLRLMNITRMSLFPGLDGFAQSFRTLLVRDDFFKAHERSKHSRLLRRLARYARRPRRTKGRKS